MININLFTSGKHTQPLIQALKQADNINLLNIYSKLPRKVRLSEPRGKADLFLVADFGEKMPLAILKTPKSGSVCLHPSLLPQYRGTSPVQTAILNADQETGVTLFQMDERFDHGPILGQVKEKIQAADTQESLSERLFLLGAKIFFKYLSQKTKPRKQNDDLATYTKKLTKEDGRIDWKKSPVEIERFIRAMNPWPGSWTILRDKDIKILRLKILKAHLEDKKLAPDLVQLEGKKPITWPQFLAGHPDFQFS